MSRRNPARIRRSEANAQRSKGHDNQWPTDRTGPVFSPVRDRISVALMGVSA